MASRIDHETLGAGGPASTGRRTTVPDGSGDRPAWLNETRVVAAAGAHVGWQVLTVARESGLWLFLACAVIAIVWAWRLPQSPRQLTLRALSLGVAAGVGGSPLFPGLDEVSRVVLSFWLVVGGFYYAVAIGRGILMPRHRQAPAADWLDSSTGLYNAAGLFAFGDRLLAAAGEARVSSLALFDFGDLREVREVYGSSFCRQVAAQVISRLRALAGQTGFVAHTGDARFVVMLPGRNREQALDAIHRAMGGLACVEFEVDGHEILLVPDWGVKAAPAGGGSCESLYWDLRVELSRARHAEDQHQQYLHQLSTRRERQLRRESERRAQARVRAPLLPERAPVHGRFSAQVPTTMAMPVSAAR